MESILKDVILMLSYLVFLFILVLTFQIINIIRKEKIVMRKPVGEFNLNNTDRNLSNLNITVLDDIVKLKKENRDLRRIAQNISASKIDEIEDVNTRKFSLLNIDKKTFWIYFFIILIVVIFLILLIVNPQQIFYERG